LQKAEIRYLSLTQYKINSKWVKHLTVRSETFKLPEENIVERLQDTDIDNDSEKDSKNSGNESKVHKYVN
jgi:hypothetical protein